LLIDTQAAADYIEQHGWATGNWKDIDGRVCATGAFIYTYPELFDIHGVMFTSATYERRARNREKLLKVLNTHCDGGDFLAWNDSRCASAEEAVAKLRSIPPFELEVL